MVWSSRPRAHGRDGVFLIKPDNWTNAANGGYFLSADDAADLVVRPGATSDDATPNPNAVAAENLLRLP